jgi:hypothetical protein
VSQPPAHRNIKLDVKVMIYSFCDISFYISKITQSFEEKQHETSSGNTKMKNTTLLFAQTFFFNFMQPSLDTQTIFLFLFCVMHNRDI